MKRVCTGKNCFDQKEIDKFSYDLSVPEYFVTHRECVVCKIGQQENLAFRTPHMCVMDYPTIEYDMMLKSELVKALLEKRIAFLRRVFSRAAEERVR